MASYGADVVVTRFVCLGHLLGLGLEMFDICNLLYQDPLVVLQLGDCLVEVLFVLLDCGNPFLADLFEGLLAEFLLCGCVFSTQLCHVLDWLALSADWIFTGLLIELSSFRRCLWLWAGFVLSFRFVGHLAD